MYSSIAISCTFLSLNFLTLLCFLGQICKDQQQLFENVQIFFQKCPVSQIPGYRLIATLSLAISDYLGHLRAIYIKYQLMLIDLNQYLNIPSKIQEYLTNMKHPDTDRHDRVIEELALLKKQWASFAWSKLKLKPRIIGEQ